MTLFLNGGGSGAQVTETYRILKEKIDTSKPLLYIPLAMREDRYAGCLEWITAELADFHFPNIDMVSSPDQLCNKDFSDYAALFIGGGNTYKLLSDLKSCDAFDKISSFVRNNGVVYGGSAGAILFGKNIDSCRYDDPNDVNLIDIAGFNMAFGAYIGAHYPNKKPEKTQMAEACFTELSFDAPVIALPEEDTLIIDKDTVQIIGSKDFYVFLQGKRYPKNANKVYLPEEFQKLLDRP